MNKKVEITTATITIKVIQIDGHKMTKAVFRQIEQSEWDDLNIDFRHNSQPILGWVNDRGMWLVFELDSTLGRTLVPKYFTEITKDCFDQLFIAT